MGTGHVITRRRFLQASGVAAVAALLHGGAIAAATGGAAAGGVDPNATSIPLVFPLASGTYQAPVRDTWHDGRLGKLQAWSHRNGTTRRAHDGEDLFPLSGQPLPPVYAPFPGTVAAVYAPLRAKGSPAYRASTITPPPWDYSQAGPPGAAQLYGNFVWLYSTADDASGGYFVFYCHLQNEPVVRGLAPDQPVTIDTQVGLLGDSGNADGQPQLHVEIHCPAGSSFTCPDCTPEKGPMTAINPYLSLANATPR